MSCKCYSLQPATPAIAADIETLLDKAFGLGRRTKTSYRLREGETAVVGLSFIARLPDGGIAGSISYWPIRIGDKPALLLGPLAVTPCLQGSGIGLALMAHTLELAEQHGHALVILVGDEPYYARAGFKKLPKQGLIMPGYVEPGRLLFRELQPGAAEKAHGLVLGENRYRALHGRGS